LSGSKPFVTHGFSACEDCRELEYYCDVDCYSTQALCKSHVHAFQDSLYASTIWVFYRLSVFISVVVFPRRVHHSCSVHGPTSYMYSNPFLKPSMPCPFLSHSPIREQDLGLRYGSGARERLGAHERTRGHGRLRICTRARP